MGSGANAFTSVFNQELAHKHQVEKEQRDATATLYGSAIKDFLENPATSVTLEAFQHYSEQYSKLLPKELQEPFQNFVHQQIGKKSAAQNPAPMKAVQQAPVESALQGQPVQGPPQPPTLPQPPPGAPPPISENGPPVASPPSLPSLGLPSPSPVQGGQPASVNAPISGLPGPGTNSIVGNTASVPSLPPPTPQGNGFTVSPEELGRRKAAIVMPTFTGELGAQTSEQLRAAQSQAALHYAVIQQRIQDLKSSGDWDKLTPRQRTEIQMGAPNVTAEPHFGVPGLTQGSTLPVGSTEYGGQPVDPKAFYRVQMVNGQPTYFRELGTTTTKTEIDPNAPNRVSNVVRDRAGNEINRNTNALPPPSLIPRTTSGSTERTVNVGGEMVKMPFGSSRTVTPQINFGGATPHQGGGNLPGGAPPRSLPKPNPPSSGPNSSPSSSNPNLPRGAQVLGPSAAEQRRMEENPLTPATQKILQENEPVHAQLDRAMRMLDPVKDSNLPFADALKRAGYSVGLASDASNLINNLELGKVIGAARVLRGSSRGIKALEIAMTHLPDPRKDSPRLMYEKLQNIKQNLMDIDESAKRYGQKYPGLQRPNPTSSKGPSIGTVEDGYRFKGGDPGVQSNWERVH